MDAKELKDLNQINRAYNREMKKLNRKSSVNREKDVEALKRSHSLKIKSLLSSEKYRNYLEMKKKEEESDAN